MWSSEPTKPPKLVVVVVVVAAQEPTHPYPHHPTTHPYPRGEGGHRVQGHDSEAEEKQRLWAFFTFAFVFWQSRAAEQQSWRLVHLRIRVPAYVRLHRNPAGV